MNKNALAGPGPGPASLQMKTTPALHSLIHSMSMLMMFCFSRKQRTLAKTETNTPRQSSRDTDRIPIFSVRVPCKHKLRTIQPAPQKGDEKAYL